MASTGCGKTFANARIMYALADEQEGCRFTVAMGLRTLTLQTGDALRNRLKLDDDDLAVLIGSGAVKQLWQKEKNRNQTGIAPRRRPCLKNSNMFIMKAVCKRGAGKMVERRQEIVGVSQCPCFSDNPRSFDFGDGRRAWREAATGDVALADQRSGAG